MRAAEEVTEASKGYTGPPEKDLRPPASSTVNSASVGLQRRSRLADGWDKISCDPDRFDRPRV